jgi:ribonuclease PH
MDKLSLIALFQTMITRLGSEMILPLILAGKDGRISKDEFKQLINHAFERAQVIFNEYSQKQFGEKLITGIKPSFKGE